MNKNTLRYSVKKFKRTLSREMGGFHQILIKIKTKKMKANGGAYVVTVNNLIKPLF